MRTRRTRVAESVRLCVETGVAGLSIEDSTGDDAMPLYDFDLALARVRAARAAIDKAGGDVVFTARTEGFVRGRPDLDETIRRLKAFADAGADCLYSPGIKTREQIVAMVQGGGAEAGQLADVERQRIHGERHRRHRRAPHQRRRHARARGLARAACARRARSPSTAGSTASPASYRMPSSTPSFRRRQRTDERPTVELEGIDRRHTWSPPPPAGRGRNGRAVRTFRAMGAK